MRFELALEELSRASRLASSSIVAMLIDRLSVASPELRVLAAQAVENAACVLEELALRESDLEQRDLFRNAVLEVEKIHSMAFGIHRMHNH